MDAARSDCSPSKCEPRTGEIVREQDLPSCVRHQLEAARAARPESVVQCMAFHTLERGRIVARMGTEGDVAGDRDAIGRPRAKDLLVLCVRVTESSFEAVQSVTHVLVARTRRRNRADDRSPETGSTLVRAIEV